MGGRTHYALIPLALAALLGGCADSETVPGAISTGAGGSGGGPDPCPDGQITGPAGACMPVGIQGCADLFVDEEDGLCHPRLDQCPAGTIPKLDEGCVPVGIQDCAEVFMEDGWCQPTMSKCPAGTFAAPLDGCVPIDGPDGCGTGTWGHIPDGPDTIWVDPAYAGGDGVGTPDKPLLTIAEALAVVPAGGRIALAAGTYDEPLTLEQPVEIVGRCPSMVAITGVQLAPVAQPIDVTVVVNETEGVIIRGLRISGPAIGMFVAHAGALVEGVHIDQAAIVAIVALGAATQLTLERTLINGTLPAPDGTYGRAMEIGLEAEVAVSSSALVANRDVAVMLVSDATLALTGSLIEDTLPEESTQLAGRALGVQAGGNLVVSSSALVGNRNAGIHLADPGTTATVTETSIAGTLPDGSGFMWGRAVEVQTGAELTVSSSLLIENQDVALYVSAASAQVSECLVADTLPQQNDGAGDAVMVVDGGSLDLSWSTIARNHGSGLTVGLPGTSATITGCLIEGTLPDQSATPGGRGVSVQHGASVTLSSSAVVENHEVGVLAYDAGTHLSVTESIVEDTRPLEGAYGSGIAANGGMLDLVASIVQDNHTVGVDVIAGEATVQGCLIDGVSMGKFHEVDSVGNIIATYENVGHGVVAAFDAIAAVDTTRVQNCDGAGLLYDACTGSMTHVISTANRYGLVLQQSPLPAFDETCSFDGNGEMAILSDGTLPVPTPPAMPEAP